MTNATKPKLTRGRKKQGPNPIDVHVGSRIRLRRTLLGMSQQKLGEAIGLTFQQVQKYERGANRISASRLFHLTRVLDVPLSFFFDDMPPHVAATTVDEDGDVVIGDHSGSGYEPDPMVKRETLELVRAYYTISDPSVRRSLIDLAKVLTKLSSTEPT
ncbi:helix-turn-helix transcriptional regulator [Azospirillum sp. B21]|uniref:helix-turn-helix domain-containing protein n=1 Tax=unclassified Azospirillum TaxID=2630922 RepID=UPI0011F080D5|nr:MULTISPECIES: helix-turn-helix transcriptional regulator [unclassified Azospirillum]KAA0576101.1 helix-turn-helix transcriptional regulator [Azospirillum sp. B21]MDR6775128.1 DNA-binding transcriptional regulator YiaG [Azospirillum sp. BE72]